MQIAAIGTVWVSADNESHFILMHLTVGSGGNLQIWYYRGTGLHAERQHEEAARQQLISDWPTRITSRSRSWIRIEWKRRRPAEAGRRSISACR
jgi:hypothetical protein